MVDVDKPKSLSQVLMSLSEPPEQTYVWQFSDRAFSSKTRSGRVGLMDLINDKIHDWCFSDVDSDEVPELLTEGSDIDGDIDGDTDLAEPDDLASSSNDSPSDAGARGIQATKALSIEGMKG